MCVVLAQYGNQLITHKPQLALKSLAVHIIMNGNFAESQRGAMVCSFRAGKTNSEISAFNNIPYNTVKGFRWVFDQYLEEGGDAKEFDNKRAQHKHRSDAHGDETVDQLQQLVVEDPGQSMRAMARQLGVSDFLIRKIMKEDIWYKSYSLQRRQFVTAETKERHLMKARSLLARIKNPLSSDILIFYSDEKNFLQKSIVKTTGGSVQIQRRPQL